uniref:Uncharacterized protein n=1 Tax=Picea sitchensis TaxID=3332 RepID=A9NLD2_PICSI|nr:unknown [Picea sitchensis]ABK26782.1 unknown [Picea sitchensis]
MSGQGPNVNCSPHVAGPKVNTGNNIGSINPINTDCNFGKQANNHGNQFNNEGNRGTQFNNQDNQGRQVYNQGNRGRQFNNYGDNGTQNIQGDYGKQANNSGTQYQPDFKF